MVGSAPSASASAAMGTPPDRVLSLSSGGCWGDARGTPDELLARAESRCAQGMRRIIGPTSAAAPLTVAAVDAPACVRFAVIAEGGVYVKVSDATGVVAEARGDAGALAPVDGPLCTKSALTVTVESKSQARVAAWRAPP